MQGPALHQPLFIPPTLMLGRVEYSASQGGSSRETQAPGGRLERAAVWQHSGNEPQIEVSNVSSEMGAEIVLYYH